MPPLARRLQWQQQTRFPLKSNKCGGWYFKRSTSSDLPGVAISRCETGIAELSAVVMLPFVVLIALAMDAIVVSDVRRF